MNSLERQMVELLRDLRDNHGVTEVKAEFESEGARLNELMRLKDIASRCGVGIILKIGGPEAIRDIHDALLLGVSSIVAPMVETPYALQKFLEAAEKNIPEDENVQLAVNIETGEAYKNFAKMLAMPEAKRLARITVGRVDLSESLKLGREKINSIRIFTITRNICQMARNAGMSPTLGGAIDSKAISFIRSLAKENLVDRFETRKIVFETREGIKKIAEGLKKAALFELQWLCNKHDHYDRAAREDKARIRMIEKRSLL